MKSLFYFGAIWALSLTHVLAESGDKLTLGWVEPVLIDKKLAVKLDAKLDTGADSSSLDARDIRRVRVGEKRYIRFSIEDRKSGELVEFRKPYLRRVRIKRHGGDYQRRYVVRMKICIGDQSRNIDVNLIDRENFDYPMLLGRSALKGWAIVDPVKKRTIKPTCWDEQAIADAAADPDDESDGSDAEEPEQPDITDETGRIDAAVDSGKDSEQPDVAADDTSGSEQPDDTMDAATGSEQPDKAVDAEADSEQPDTALDAAADSEQPDTALDAAADSEQPDTALDAAADSEQPDTALDAAAGSDLSDTTANAESDSDQTGIAIDVAADSEQPDAAMDSAVKTDVPVEVAVETHRPAAVPDAAEKSDLPDTAIDAAVKAEPTATAIPIDDDTDSLDAAVEAVDLEQTDVGIDFVPPRTGADTNNVPAPGDNNDSDGDESSVVENPESPSAQ